MEAEITKIYKDQEIKPQFMSHGNFSIFFPKIKLSIMGIGFSVTEEGKLSLKPPRQMFYYLDDNGKQMACRVPVVKFENNEQVWENIKKALRKKLVAEMTVSNKESED